MLAAIVMGIYTYIKPTSPQALKTASYPARQSPEHISVAPAHAVVSAAMAFVHSADGKLPEQAASKAARCAATNYINIIQLINIT